MQLTLPSLLAFALAGCATDRTRTSWPAALEPAPISSGPAAPARPSAGAATQEAGPADGDASRFTVLVGVRSLTQSDWEPVDDQLVFGFDFGYEPPDSVCGVELGMQVSFDEHDEPAGEVQAGTSEIHAGVRRTFARTSRLQPYVGLGLSVINLEVDLPGVMDDDDQTFAGYVRGGLVVFLGDTFFVGADVRTLFGSDIDLDGAAGDIDFTQLAFTVGWAF